MKSIKIAVLNQFTGLSNQDVAKLTNALQKQVSGDFAPVWGIDADLEFYPNGNPPADAWQLIILDNSDQANALGYHDVTAEGLPLGKVFAGSDMRAGTKWSVTASHELLEMLGDPDINLTVFVENNNGTGVLYAYENCDACEADQYGYDIDGYTVSDFVYPSWFQSFRPAGTQFDHANHITQPFQLLPGGYIGVFDVYSGGGWQQKYAETTNRSYSMRAHIGSRRERRKTPREQWMHSSTTATLTSKQRTEKMIKGEDANTKQITFNVKFYDGKGGIWFFDYQGSMGTGVKVNSDQGDNQSFTVNQTLGDQLINVSGNAPNGGKITVEVSDSDGNIITPASKNVFDGHIIDSFIQPYTVK